MPQTPLSQSTEACWTRSRSGGRRRSGPLRNQLRTPPRSESRPRRDSTAVADKCPLSANNQRLSKGPELGTPLWSFRRFVLSKPAAEVDSVAPAKLVEQYKSYEAEHQKDSMERYWNAHSGHGILRDRFHQSHLQRVADQRLQRVRKASANFLQKLNKGGFDKLTLSQDIQTLKDAEAVAPGLALAKVMQAEVPASLFPVDVKMVLIVEQVSAALSVWELHDRLCQINGFEDISLEATEFGSAMRTGFVRFSSDADLTGALAQLKDGLNVKDVNLKVRRALTEETPNRVLLVPSSASNALRMSADQTVAAELITVLEAAVGMDKTESEKALASMHAASMGGEQRSTVPGLLDLYVLYLRHVHYCCFYRGVWCFTPWDLARLSGVACCRQAAGVIPAASAENDIWAPGHSERLQALLEKARSTVLPQTSKIARETDELSIEEDPLRTRWQTYCSSVIIKEAEQKFRCKTCKKAFKGEAFVLKHILKAHEEAVNVMKDEIMAEREQAAHSFMKQAFFADVGFAREAQAALALECASGQRNH
eukprot:TRINITY_DN24486_c0_g1_i1.p1 TRINITY_DN24486_c0_g1~~TRINITY_DN24486_c0_g1_i1.p1  ORF type:complete len:559 (+),score=121.30 TRINITY_DN24486_c0_g1_i1:63-1679(+)